MIIYLPTEIIAEIYRWLQLRPWDFYHLASCSRLLYCIARKILENQSWHFGQLFIKKTSHWISCFRLLKEREHGLSLYLGNSYAKKSIDTYKLFRHHNGEPLYDKTYELLNNGDVYRYAAYKFSPNIEGSCWKLDVIYPNIAISSNISIETVEETSIDGRQCHVITDVSGLNTTNLEKNFTIYPCVRSEFTKKHIEYNNFLGNQKIVIDMNTSRYEEINGKCVLLDTFGKATRIGALWQRDVKAFYRYSDDKYYIKISTSGRMEIYESIACNFPLNKEKQAYVSLSYYYINRWTGFVDPEPYLTGTLLLKWMHIIPRMRGLDDAEREPLTLISKHHYINRAEGIDIRKKLSHGEGRLVCCKFTGDITISDTIITARSFDSPAIKIYVKQGKFDNKLRARGIRIKNCYPKRTIVKIHPDIARLGPEVLHNFMLKKLMIMPLEYKLLLVEAVKYL